MHHETEEEEKARILREMEEDDDEPFVGDAEEQELEYEEEVDPDDDLYPDEEDELEQQETQEEYKVPSVYTHATNLDEAILRIHVYMEQSKLEGPMLRQVLFEQTMRPLAERKGQKFEDILLASTPEDTNYNQLIKGLYPALAPYLDKVQPNEDVKALLNLINEALDILLKVPQQEPPKQEPPKQPEPPKPQPKPEPELEEDYENDPEVIANTARVMNVYKDLFEVGFELKVPYGMLTKDGELRIDNGEVKERGSKSLKVMYNMINELTGNQIDQASTMRGKREEELRNISISPDAVYYPAFQLNNLLGVIGTQKYDSWSKLSTALEPKINDIIATNIKRGNDIEHIVDSLTTAIVISEFNPKTAITLRINIGNNLISANDFRKAYEMHKTDFMAGIGELYHIDTTKAGVIEVIIVFNMAAFNGRPLFAYEAVENLQQRGQKPSLRKMVLGQDTSGKILTTNLDSQQACIILVGAGQRSGKGVLTLNLLGTILSEGAPLIYMDGKPDMAPVLWSMGERYGVNPAAWDLFDNHGNQIGNGAPETMIVENPGLFGLLMYYKVLQLMMVAASLQAKDYKFLDDKRPFFIFDEAYAVQMHMSSVWKKVISYAKDKKGEDAELREWSTVIAKWGESLDSDLPAIINSQLPKSGVSTVWLFQSMQPASWTPFQVDSLGSGKINVMKKPIESRLSIKFLGRGTNDSEYALGSPKIKANPLIINRVQSDGGRHFAMTGSQKVLDMDTVKVFKPYLVLNQSEDGTKAAEELKGNLSPDVLKVVAPNGSLDPRAGFEQFANMLGEGAIQNLSKGREYLEAVMRTIGLMDKYNSVEEYIYDASAESFQSMGALVRGAEGENGSSEESDIYMPSFDSQPKPNVTGVNNGFNENEDPEEGEESPTNQSNQPDWVNDDSPFVTPSMQQTQSLDPFNQDIDTPTDGFETPPIQQAQPTAPPIESDPTVSPNDISQSANVFTPDVQVVDNPFKRTRSHGILSTIGAVGQMSKQLLVQIERMLGSLERVESIEFTNGGIIINDIAFQPKFDQAFIDSLPFAIRQQVESGNLTELFHFADLKKFKNLMILRIDNVRLAEGRVRRELGLHPKRSWFTLFFKFRNLRELYIAGERISDEPSSQEYEDNGRAGYDFEEQVRKGVGMPEGKLEPSPLNKLWKTKPVRVMGKAAGWTAAVKGVALATAAFGVWGVIFGAFAGYGAYKASKSRSEQQ